jgi:hypothetical protein
LGSSFSDFWIFFSEYLCLYCISSSYHTLCSQFWSTVCILLNLNELLCKHSLHSSLGIWSISFSLVSIAGVIVLFWCHHVTLIFHTSYDLHLSICSIRYFYHLYKVAFSKWPSPEDAFWGLSLARKVDSDFILGLWGSMCSVAEVEKY